MSKSIQIKEVKGFNGMSYSDYNRYRSRSRGIWLFYVVVDHTNGEYRSRCHLDEKHLPRIEHSGAISDAEIELLAQWLLEN